MLLPETCQLGRPAADPEETRKSVVHPASAPRTGHWCIEADAGLIGDSESDPKWQVTAMADDNPWFEPRRRTEPLLGDDREWSRVGSRVALASL